MEEPVHSFTSAVFGGRMSITLFGMERDMAEIIARDGFDLARKLQDVFNIYDEKSEISRLNRKRKLKCSPELLEVLNIALEYSRKTGGLYDVSLGRLFLARKKGFLETVPGCSYRDISIRDGMVCLGYEDALVDLGSIAKGYIIDKVVELLVGLGAENGIVDGRGDMRCFGSRENIIAVRHPRQKDAGIASIMLRDEAVATSGDYNQFFGSFDASHIINGRRFSSVTVVASSLCRADVLATAISVLDEKMAGELTLTEKGIKVLTISKDLKKTWYGLVEG